MTEQSSSPRFHFRNPALFTGKTETMHKIRRAMFLVVLLWAVGSYACSSPTAPSPPSPTSPSQSSPTASSRPIVVYEAGSSGVINPTLVSSAKPFYTADAIRNRVQGSVVMAAVVLADGTVGDVTVLQSLDTVYGLDAEAARATKQWLFTPGLKDGVPVAVRVTVNIEFRLSS